MSVSVRFLDLLFAKMGGVENDFPIEGSLESICQCFLIMCLICVEMGEKVVESTILWPVEAEGGLGERRAALFNSLTLDLHLLKVASS